MRTTFAVAVVVAAAMLATAVEAQERISVGRFTDVALYRPAGEIKSFVLFLSGDGGWNLGVIDMAQALAGQGALVAGISVPQFLASLEKDGAKCVRFDRDLEDVSRFVQTRAGLPRYHAPLVVGYSSGATLAYGVLVQAPSTFGGALSLGFCPDLAVREPPCEGQGLESVRRKTAPGFDLLPSKGLAKPWIVLNGVQDMVCDIDATERFVQQSGGARLVKLPHVGHGFGVPRNWMPQFLDAFRAIEAAAAQRG
jgi:type IV secretory pathway VirJ component